MGKALTDRETALGTAVHGDPVAQPLLAPQQRTVHANSTVVRLREGDALRPPVAQQRRVPPPSPTFAVPITVLTAKSDLCDLVRAAAPALHRIFRATNLEDAEELAATDRCAILITDETIVRSELEHIIGILRTHEPAIVTILVGSSDDDDALVDLLANGVIDRFMVHPLKPDPTRLVIESAAREHQSLKPRKQVHPAESVEAKQPAARPARKPVDLGVTPSFHRSSTHSSPATVETSRAVAPAPSAVAPQRSAAPIPTFDLAMIRGARGSTAQSANTLVPTLHHSIAAAREPAFDLALTRVDWRSQETLERYDAYTHRSPTPAAAWLLPAAPRSAWFGAVIGTVVTACIVAWVIFSQSPDNDAQRVIAANLKDAQQAYAQDRLIEPPESNALLSYRRVLALDSNNAAAQAGVDRVADRLIDEARRFIDQQRLAEALERLQDARRVRPNNPQLAALDARLRAVLQERLLQQSRAAAADATADQPAVERTAAPRTP